MNNYDIWWFVQPSHSMLWLIVAAALLTLFHTTGRTGLVARLALVLSTALYLLAAFGPLTGAVMAPLEDRFPPPASDTPAPEVIIVLAGAEQALLTDARSEPHLGAAADRLTSFLMLANRFPDATLVHSGAGREVNGTSQSTVARRLFDGALPGREVLYEDRSGNTFEAAVEVRRMLGTPTEPTRWWLVTSAFHMPRSVAVFRAAGLDVVPWPTDFHGAPAGYDEGSSPSLGLPQATSTLHALDFATHEWLGLLWYRLHGYTQELFPRPEQPPASPPAP